MACTCAMLCCCNALHSLNCADSCASSTRLTQTCLHTHLSRTHSIPACTCAMLCCCCNAHPSLTHSIPGAKNRPHTGGAESGSGGTRQCSNHRQKRSHSLSIVPRLFFRPLQATESPFALGASLPIVDIALLPLAIIHVPATISLAFVLIPHVCERTHFCLMGARQRQLAN